MRLPVGVVLCKKKAEFEWGCYDYSSYYNLSIFGNNETRERMSAITVRYVLVRVGKRVGATAKTPCL